VSDPRGYRVHVDRYMTRFTSLEYYTENIMKRGHAWEEYLARRNDTFTNVYRKQLNT
jgi:hypothetical protein